MRSDTGFSLALAAPETSDDLKCNICKAAFTQLQTYNLTPIFEGVKSLCFMVPPKYKCPDVVSQIDDLIKNYTPADSCIKIGMCKKVSPLTN